MPWARLEDTFWCSPKIVDAGNAAVGIYARALSYCAMHTTDGYVPKAVAEALATAAANQAVEQAGLWQAVEPGDTFQITGRRDSGNRPLQDAEVTAPGRGYFIPDFLHFHLTKRETAERREQKQAAGRARAKAPAIAPAQAPAAPDARSTRPRVPTPTPILTTTSSGADDDREKVEGACELLGWTPNQRARAHTTEPGLLLAIAAHALAVGDNPGGLAWAMLTTGQDPRASKEPSLAAGATGTRSTSKPTDAVGRCRKWIAGASWDETLSPELAADELLGICRRADSELAADVLADLLAEWTTERARRYAAALIEGAAA